MDWQQNPQDYEVTCPVRERGGQHAGTSSKVKVVHIPTGLTVECEARSQHKSRKICMEMIEWGLSEM